MKRLTLAPLTLAFALLAGSAHGDNEPPNAPRQELLSDTHLAPLVHSPNGGRGSIGDSQSFADAARVFAGKVAKVCLFVAWPTAKYKSWAFQDVTPNRNGGGELTFRVFGTSAWTGKEIWVDVIMTVDKDFKVTGLRWGEYHAFVPPGSALKALEELSK